VADLEMLKSNCAEAWEMYVTHPLFEEIGTGNFNAESMCFWLVQDLLYVAMHQRVRERLAARVLAEPRLASLHERISAPEWSQEAAAEEIALEADLLRSLGGDPPTNEFGLKPAREGFINYVARISFEGSIAEMVASLLPCEAGFSEAHAGFDENAPGLPEFSRRWLEFFRQPGTLDVTTELFAESSQLPEAPSDEVLIEVFRRSLEHQIDVLDAAWRAEDDWPSEQTMDRRLASALRSA
jgi:thiaminase (transcriptional activator TenA)